MSSGALAEFERDLIKERTEAGLAAARARGRHGGRPTVMTEQKLAIARQMYDSKEHTVAAIAGVLGVSRASLYRSLQPNASGVGVTAEALPSTATRRSRSRAAKKRSLRPRLLYQWLNRFRISGSLPPQPPQPPPGPRPERSLKRGRSRPRR